MELPNWLKKYRFQKQTRLSGKARKRGIWFGRGGIKNFAGSSVIGSTDPLAIYRSGATKAVPADRAMASNTGWVYASRKAIADAIRTIEFEVYQIKGNNHERQYNHDLLDLLEAPHEDITGVMLKDTIASHLYLVGNCYLLKGGSGKDGYVKNATEKPQWLYPLPPDHVRVIKDETTFPFKIRGYEFRINSYKKIYEPYQIFHIMDPDPADMHEGLGVPQAIASWVDLNNQMVEYNRQYFIRGIKLGQVLKMDSTDQASVERAKITFEESHQGVENAHRLTAIPTDWDLVDNGKPKDVDYKSGLDGTRDMIMGGSRVGYTLLGVAEAATNRATAETADYVFAKRRIKPLMDLIEAFINEKIAPLYGDDVYVTYLDPTQEDKATRITEMQAANGNQPIMSVNEARKRYLGLGPVQGGDSVMVSGTLVPVGSPVKEDPNNEQQAHQGDKSVKTHATQFSRNAKRREDLKKITTNTFKSILSNLKTKSVFKYTDEDWRIVGREYLKRMDDYENTIREGLIKINAAQETEVLENLKKIFDKKGITPIVRKFNFGEVFDTDKWIKIVINFATPILTELATNESKQAGDMFGEPGINYEEHPEFMSALDKVFKDFAASYTQTTSDAVKEQVSNGLAEGLGYQDIANNINENVYKNTNEVRAYMVARTETMRTGNIAKRATWKQVGVKTMKWVTIEDDKTCAYCDSLDGQSISIDKNWFNKGDSLTVGGETLNLGYADIQAPPLHINCRCQEIPDDIGNIQSGS